MAEEFGVTEEEVLRRKKYLEITTLDEDRLRAAHGLVHEHAPQLIENFYRYLLGHEYTLRILAAPGLIDRLKVLQAQYFLELTSGEYGRAYFENRIRVGQVHHRIGLSPEWYIGAYLKYLHLVSDVLSKAFGRDQEQFFQTSVSLTKIVHLDIGLTLDAYHRSAQEVANERAAELERSNSQLRQLQASKKLLTELIVHDLQNPLTGINGLLQILEGTVQTEDVRGAVREGLSCCNNLSEMIHNVLGVSRAESGKLTAFPEETDLAEVVAGAVQTFRSSYSQEGRNLLLEAPAALPVQTDRLLVRRIVQNLLRNALRHTPPGTRVVVRLQPLEGGRARLSVIDNGLGIPRELQESLFNPDGVAKLRKAGLRVDSGLGLVFCQVASGALGGIFTLESDGRTGTTFILELPSQITFQGN